MDVEQEKSSVNRLNIGRDINFDGQEDVNKKNMWTIPSLTEEYVRDLMEKFSDLMKDITKKHIIPYITIKRETIQLENASIHVLGPNNEKWKIISGHGVSKIIFQCTDLNDPVITLKADADKPEEMYNKEITKTFLGKCIIQKCGNEGTNKNESLRILLQVVIDQLFDKYDKKILKNAKVCIYDSMETLIIVSGDGRNSFVINSADEPPLLRYITKEEKKGRISNMTSRIQNIFPIGQSKKSYCHPCFPICS